MNPKQMFFYLFLTFWSTIFLTNPLEGNSRLFLGVVSMLMIIHCVLNLLALNEESKK